MRPSERESAQCVWMAELADTFTMVARPVTAVEDSSEGKANKANTYG